MGRHQYVKEIKVTTTGQGQRTAYYDQHDNRDARDNIRGGGASRGGGNPNRVWRRGDRRVSFNDRRGGITKGTKFVRGGTRSDRPKLAAAILENDEDMRVSSYQRGRARPTTRGRGRYIRGSMRNNPSIDRVPRFVTLAPLSDENKKLIQEAMNNNYNVENKALNLEKFGKDPHFGGSSGAIGKLTHSGVVEVILDTIGTHLPDLRYLSLADNQLKSLNDFSKLHEKAPNIHTLYLQKNHIFRHKELDHITQLRLTELKLDGNPMVANFRDGTHFGSIIQKKFKTLQRLDEVDLPKLITFEEEGSTSQGPSRINIPMQPKMVVNQEAETCITQFVQKFFEVYDTDHREHLIDAYHEEALMSFSSSFNRSIRDDSVKRYIGESRNLQVIQEYKRSQLIHQKRVQIVGFLDKLPKTKHDITSFTLDVPFVNVNENGGILSFTVTGVFKEREEQSYPVKHFSRMFVALLKPGPALSIVNDTLFVTHSTLEESKRTNTLFEMAEKSRMNLDWSKQCLDAQNWNLEQALNVFVEAKEQGKIPAEAFTSV